MKLITKLCAIMVAAVVMLGTALTVGDKAPDFTLQASDGQTYQLSEILKDQAVVLAWYPKAFTKGCTIECKSLVEKGHLIREYDVAYFMISVDPVEDVTKFAESMQADFPLLADPDKSIAEQYGVMHEWGFSKRHNVYINMNGEIIAIDEEVRPETAAEDIAARLGELGVSKQDA